PASRGLLETIIGGKRRREHRAGMFAAEPAARAQNGVANAFGIKPPAVGPAEPSVLDVFAIRGRGLSISVAEHDRPHQFLHRPAVADKLRGKVVEQFRVRWAFAGGPEVVDGADQAGAEKPVPGSVRIDPRRQRIVLGSDPFTELLAAALILGHRCEATHAPDL